MAERSSMSLVCQGFLSLQIHRHRLSVYLPGEGQHPWTFDNTDAMGLFFLS